MLFDIALYITLIVFGIGMIYKISGWFRQNVGMAGKDIPTARRFYAAVKGALGTLFSGKITVILKVFLLDVLLQRRILKDKEDRTVWIMHIFMFVGFLLLLLMHALDSIITASLFSDYESTLNPFRFLRNLFGLFVLAGLVLAVVRRAFLKRDRLRTTRMDYFVIAILIVIITSGFLHEATKISSYSVYQRMVDDYADASDENELHALKAFWTENFGVVSAGVNGPASDEGLAQGEELHEVSCAACHSRPHWAFVSYPLSRATSSIAIAMDNAGIHSLLWYIHFLACFLGLAYLPFSKIFHIFATSVSLLVTETGEMGKEDPVNVATRQMIELDGCSHGGTCHTACPVRQKRQQRIEMTTQFSPVLDHVSDKNSKDLGNRSIGE